MGSQARLLASVPSNERQLLAEPQAPPEMEAALEFAPAPDGAGEVLARAQAPEAAQQARAWVREQAER